MKRVIYIGLVTCCYLLAFKAIAQQTNASYLIGNSKEVVETLHAVAIVPPWLELAPAKYKKHIKQLETNRTTGSLFLQNLLFIALLRNDPSLEKKVIDIYSTNESLARHKVDILELPIAMSPTAICELLGADAVLLTLTSYNKKFLMDHPHIVQLLEPIPWNGSLKKKNLVIVLFHKTGVPIWAVAMQSLNVKSTLREHEYLYMVNTISMYGNNL